MLWVVKFVINDFAVKGLNSELFWCQWIEVCILCTRFLFTPKSDPNEMLAFRRVEGLLHALCRIWRRLVTGGWYKSPLPRNFLNGQLCIAILRYASQIWSSKVKFLKFGIKLRKQHIDRPLLQPIHTTTKLLCRVRSVTVCKNLTCMHAVSAIIHSCISPHNGSKNRIETATYHSIYLL